MTPLRRRMLEDMGIRDFAENTQQSYLQHFSLFARSPDGLGPEQVRQYQVHLVEDRKLAPSSISIAVSALRFLYKVTLRQPWAVDDIPMPKKPFTLPVILSPEEVARFLESVHGKKHRVLRRPACDAACRSYRRQTSSSIDSLPWFTAATRSAHLGPDLRVECVQLPREAQPLTRNSLVDKTERLRSRDDLQNRCDTFQLADQQVQPRLRRLRFALSLGRNVYDMPDRSRPLVGGNTARVRVRWRLGRQAAVVPRCLCRRGQGSKACFG